LGLLPLPRPSADRRYVAFAFEGTKTAALQTLGIEGRFSAALQTWRREVAKVGT
jgi:hypothetical protein